MQTKQKVLVLADPATGSPELIATLRRRGTEAPTSFTLLVPAGDGGSAAGWSQSLSRAATVAAQARRAGVDLEETIVGDSDPALAIGDAVHARDFDRVIAAGGEWTDVAPAAEPFALAA